MAKTKPATEDLSPTFTVPRWARIVISILVTVHVAAVVAPPLAFICRSRGSESPIAGPLARFVRPYCQALYLDHGYAFFAPDPGPNHLVDYKVEFEGGKPPITGRFPDLEEERPRLLYHRYFMLSEALNTRFVPPAFAPEPSPPALTASAMERERYQTTKNAYEADREVWKHQRKQYEAMRASIELHLKHEFGGDKVQITRIEHRPADPDEIQIERRTLDAKDTYREMSETPTRTSTNGGGQ